MREVVSKKYTFVYETTNIHNGKKYIGVHTTDDLEDGYIGNGIYSDKISSVKRTTAFGKAVIKYGYNSFKREILKFFDSYQEALEFEEVLVTIEEVRSDRYYNSCIGGGKSPTTGIGHSEEARKKMSAQRKGSMKGSKNRKAKLDEEKVLDIRVAYISRLYSVKQLAEMFQVSVATIRDISNNRTWETNDQLLISKMQETKEYFFERRYDYERKPRIGVNKRTREDKINYCREWRKRNPDYRKNRKVLPND